MARVPLILLLIAACGGAQIPEHNGYRSDKAKPWKKAKPLKWDANSEAKYEGDLSYPNMQRAAWFAVDLPGSGELALRVEFSGPGDGTNEDFDLGVEVFDPGNRSLIRKDVEEGDQQGGPVKTISLPELPAGHYLIHLYLQGRLDTAEYTLKATYKPGGAATGHSDFPAQVAFLPPLPTVPLHDDTPRGYKVPVTVVVHAKPKHGPPPVVKKEDKPPPPTKITTRIIDIAVVGGGTQITIPRGTANGAAAGMPGQIVGVANGGFTLGACNEHSCTAVVKATPEQLKSAISVQLGQ